MKSIIRRDNNDVNIDFKSIPKCDLDALCRPLLSAIREAFEVPKIVADYERSKTKRHT